MNMIQIQEAYIARLHAARAKIGRRASGLAFSRSKVAARKELVKALTKIGYSAHDIQGVQTDAHDMYLLEINARED